MNSKASLKKKLSKLNPDTDCVAIFTPKDGVTFYIPDSVKDTLTKDIPPHIMAVMMHAHIYKYYDSDPVIKNFADAIREHVYLDIMADEETKSQ